MSSVAVILLLLLVMEMGNDTTYWGKLCESYVKEKSNEKKSFTLLFEVPSRIELLYTVLQTVT